MKITGNEPINVIEGIYSTKQQGLTIRQHFAIIAMQGLLANGESESHLYDYAKRSVACADYVIKALNETPNPNQ